MIFEMLLRPGIPGRISPSDQPKSFCHTKCDQRGAENILEPEILLYSETDNSVKLLGVEYFYGIFAPFNPNVSRKD